MSDTLFEAGELVFLDAELFNEHIEVASLVTEVHPDTRRVVDDDERQHRGKGECAGCYAFIVGHGNQERNDKTRVGARHMTVRESVFYIEAVFETVEREFDDLREDPYRDRYEKYEIRLE